jgi:hypothetical protein
MSIQDSNAERRNLVVTSMAFIAYFYSGGELADNVVRLQIVNVKFAYPSVLGAFAWLLLLWFLYRYWLTNSGKFTSMFKAEIGAWYSKDFVCNHIASRLNVKLASENGEGFYVSRVWWENFTLYGECFHASNVNRDKITGKVTSYSKGTQHDEKRTIGFTGFSGRLLTLRAISTCFITKPSFSNYAVPYLLCICAISGGAIRLVVSAFTTGQPLH